VPARALNRVVSLLVGRLGVPLPRLRMLRVHGRRTGRLRTTPVLVLRRAGRRYLVAPRGETDWTRNLRAAGWGELIRGGRVERVRAAEVTGEERAVVVATYARRFGWLNRRFFDLPRRFDMAAARRVAERHPTFRLGANLIAILALAVTAPAGASAARSAYVIDPGALPADVPAARAALRRALAAAPTASRTHADIAYVLRLARRHLRAGQPDGRRRTVARALRVNAWWYAGHRAPGGRIVALDPGGIVSTYWEGRGFAVNPVATAGRWQGLNDALTSEALADALLPLGVERRHGARRFLLWEYYDVPDRPGAIRPGASGMAQGRIAQLMARAYHRTGETRFADAARLALASFTVPVDAGGVLSAVAEPRGARAMPWYVERAYPGASPWKGAALNGFMVTLLNLNATAPLLGSRPNPLDAGPPDQRARERAPGAEEAGRMARALAVRGERTLARYLPLHDTGTWSLYGLLTPGRKWRTYVADAGYHCYHVTLLHELAKIAPGHGFAAVSARWNQYARRAGVRCKPTTGPQRVAP
jgi:deazaflavin-dependent oxidoreductase (nitroreductase family)